MISDSKKLVQCIVDSEDADLLTQASQIMRISRSDFVRFASLRHAEKLISEKGGPGEDEEGGLSGISRLDS